MKQNKIEKAIDYILCFMKQNIEEHGEQPKNVAFIFSFSRVEQYFNAPSETIPDGEDLAALKKLYPKIKNDVWAKALKICITHEYIDDSSYNTSYEKVKITEKGMARAISVSKAAPFQNYLKNLLLEHAIPHIISVLIGSLITLIVTYFSGVCK